MTEKGTKAEEPSFEKSMERLEAIVAGMESGELNLDVMIKQFEEGQSLIRFCSKKLDEVERKIERLLTKEGPAETEPFAEMETLAVPTATAPGRDFGDMLPLGDG